MTFLVFTALAIGLGITIVVLRNRPSTSMESSIDDFQRGLRALAPEAGGDRPLPSPIGATSPAARGAAAAADAGIDADLDDDGIAYDEPITAKIDEGE